MADKDDGLFLLEVLVDKVVFAKSPCFSDKDFRTCVNIECHSVDPLEICDDDPGVCVASSGSPFIKNFNNGKSCLFSLTQSDISKAMSKFPVKVSVYKSLPCGCLPTKIQMGETTIDMTKEFVQARKKFLEDPNNVSYQALKDTFRIFGTDGTEAGEIIMFLRISCFGKLIITRFQGSSAPPKLGTGGPTIKDNSCNPARQYQSSEDPCACGAARGHHNTKKIGFGSCPIARDPYDSKPCEDLDDPCYCSGPKPPKKEQMECRNTDQYCLHVPKDCCPAGNKVIFQMPSDSCNMGHKQRAHFNFSTEGVGDIARDEPGQLMPTTNDSYPGVVYDFPAQVIKLRIGKTVEMAGRKSRMEYQFCTPTISYERKVPMSEARTAQCSSTECAMCCPARLPSIPLRQSAEEMPNANKANGIEEILSSYNDLLKNYTIEPSSSISPSSHIAKECLHVFFDHMQLPDRDYAFGSSITDSQSPSLFTLRSKKCSYSYSDYFDFASQPSRQELLDGLQFGKQDTAVFMTLVNELYSRKRCSSTQATASVNKCLQVYNEIFSEKENYPYTSNYKALSPSEVYFFGRKKCDPQPGMGSSPTNIKPRRCCNPSKAATKTQFQNLRCSTANASQCCQTICNGSSTGTSTVKAVSIKEDRAPCPALGVIKGDMCATVSHIRICPREPCPVHGMGTCQGPKCIIASTGAQEAPVRVTSAANPRRGVFELVIRRMTGAPLAKNELMLEWTPPPFKSTTCAMPCSVQCISPFIDSCTVPCSTPCSVPCTLPCTTPCPARNCRPTKCKMIVCRPPRCKTKCCKPRPCRPRLSPKKIFKPTCSGRPCRTCVRPCGPPPCRSPCTQTCGRCKSPPPCRRCRSPPICGTCRSPPRRKPCVRCKPSPCRITCAQCNSPPCKRSSCRMEPCKMVYKLASCKPCPPCLPCQPCLPCPPPSCSPCRPRSCLPCPPRPCLPCPSPRSYSPRLPSSCSPCLSPTTACYPVCCKFSGDNPCNSSPCLRPSPVKRKKSRRARSHPRTKPHKKRVSPCLNKSKCCPVVRCRSLPGPCYGCCFTYCPPRKCRSVCRPYCC